jgi:hypothetical protein
MSRLSTDRLPMTGAHGCAQGPCYITHEAGFYQVRLWSEWEWFALPEDARPHGLYVQGLGWVELELLEVLNRRVGPFANRRAPRIERRHRPTSYSRRRGRAASSMFRPPRWWRMPKP